MELLSVVVPCYNEEEVLPLFYKEITRIADRLSQLRFELVFINDGSGDGTLDIIKDIARDDKRVRYISFSRNFGKEAAIYAGLKKASGDYVVIIDADLQEPPELICDMYNLVKNEERPIYIIKEDG